MRQGDRSGRALIGLWSAREDPDLELLLLSLLDAATDLDLRHEAGRPQAQASVKQERHGSVTVAIAEGFRSASYDLSIFIRSDVRQSRRVTRNTTRSIAIRARRESST
jgi:hypothetical protein